MQRFVQTADLDKMYAAVEKILTGIRLDEIELEAFKYYYIPAQEIGLAGIIAKPTPQLLQLQEALIEAVTPFTTETGDSAAFVTWHLALGCVVLTCISMTLLLWRRYATHKAQKAAAIQV